MLKKKLQRNNVENEILPFSDETIKLLKQNHPTSADESKDVLLSDKAETVHFIKH